MTSQNLNNLGNNLNSNTSLKNHPFIWGNIALIAGVPWLLALSMAGLAVGDPVFPAWLEILLLASPAIASVAWLHWQQPFSPFSLWLLVKPAASLNEGELRVLTLLKQQRNGWYVTGWIAVAVGFALTGIFCKLYVAAPLAQAIAPFPAGLRLFGIIWAEIFFFLSNVLLQSGVSALRIKLTAESEISSLKPFAIEKIKNNFTAIGWQAPQLLKFFEEDPAFSLFEQKDAPLVETTEQTQDVVEESQDVEISDTAEETVTESNPEITESIDEDFEVNNFTEETKEVISEDEAIAQAEVTLLAEIDPELSLEISEFNSEKLAVEDDAIEDDTIAVHEELNISEFEVDSLVEITTDDEVNLGEELTTGEPAQLDFEVVADFHDDTLKEIINEVDESANEAIEEIEVILEVIDNNVALSLEEITETKFTSEEITETSEELEINEAIIEVNEALDTNEIAAESEFNTSEDVDDNNFIELTPEETEQEKFDEPELATIVDIVEDSPKSESHKISEDTLDTSSDISDIKVDLQETANDVTEDSLGLSVTDTNPEIELNESSDSVNEETLEVNLDSPFADLPEELVVGDFDADANEEITNLSDTALEIVEPKIEAIASDVDEPKTKNLEITESENEQLNALIEETVNDVIIKSEINDSVETDSATEAKIPKAKKSIDLFRKSRKKGFSQKNYGFGKSVKPSIKNEIDANQVETSIEEDNELEIGDIISEESVESRFEVADASLTMEEIVEELADDLAAESEPEIDIEAIADNLAVELDVQADLPIEQVETSESNPLDFDEELDELITFNAYVENILQDYLGDFKEESDSENQEVEDIIQIASVSEQATDIAEEVLMDEESLETSIPELIDSPAQLDPLVEAIDPASKTNPEESQEESEPPRDPKYLVQEFLVDKFLAKLEELNNADKSTNKSNLEPKPEATEVVTQDNASPLLNDESLELEQDELANLETLLNRNIPEENQE